MVKLALKHKKKAFESPKGGSDALGHTFKSKKKKG